MIVRTSKAEELVADYLQQHVDVATVRVKPEVLALWGIIFHSAHIGASGCIFCAKPVTLGKQGGIFRIARF